MIGAPAHHFGSTAGLLTEVALLAYHSLGEALRTAEATADPSARLRRLAVGCVRFALDHPERFRLLFRPNLVLLNVPRYAEASRNALSGFAEAIMQRAGASADPMAEIFIVWSAIHGRANLVQDGKAAYLFEGLSADEFAANRLPQLLIKHWPFGT